MLNPPFSLMKTQIDYVVFKLWMPNVQRISFRVILRLQQLCLCCLVAMKSTHVYYTFYRMSIEISDTPFTAKIISLYIFIVLLFINDVTFSGPLKL